LGRISGIVIFIGGKKAEAGNLVEADGVHAEREVAQRNGSFLLPIGATGGAAKTIAEGLLNDKYGAEMSAQPTKSELNLLMNEKSSPSELIAVTVEILKRISSD
jgi:hypothetical protein